MVRRGAPVLAVALLLVPSACGRATDDGAVPSGPTGTAGTAGTAGSTAPVRPDSSNPPALPASEVSVVPVKIPIEDPTAGRLTFDALAAGDPARAAEGRLVLMLHGFPQSAEAYRAILPVVAAAGYYAVAVDQRGYSPGARPLDVESYGMLHLLGDTMGLASALGADTFHLVGHDWGGGVAWAAAVLQPDRVRSLTVLSTPHPDALSDAIADPSHPQHAASAYMQVLRDVQDADLAHGLASIGELFGPENEPPPGDFALRYTKRLDTTEALQCALNWYRATPLPNPGHIGAVKVPTLYVWGGMDFTFTRETAMATSALVDAPYTFVELPELGHWLPEGASGQVGDALIRHLGANRATGAPSS